MSGFPTCKVCHQEFSLKGRAPFLLPCLHAACETCVTCAAGGVISCSTCQRDVNLTETRLEKDVITEKEILHLTVQQHPELVLCTHEDDGNQAVCWCKECEDFLCEHCQMIHGRPKITRHHVVEDIGDLQPESFDVDRYCTTHNKFVLDIWDEECSILICRKCNDREHAEHKTVDFDMVVEKTKREVANLGEKVLSYSTVAQQGNDQSTQITESRTSDKTCYNLTEKISQTFNTLKTMIDHRERELQIELQQHQEKVRREQKNTSEACQKKCQTTSDYISKTLQYSSRHDIMSLRHLVQSKTGECISSAQAIVHESPPLIRFNTDGLEKVKSVMAGFGQLKAESTQKKHTNGLFILTPDASDAVCLLNCTRVEFSKKRCNNEFVSINSAGELIRAAQINHPHSDQRLKNYRGTSSTVPLSQSGSLQFFEVKTRVGINEALKGNSLLLEIGLAREEEQDQDLWVAPRRLSYTLTVQRCPTHGSICRRVWRHGKRLLCLPDTLGNTPGTSVTLHYGVVYDTVRSHIAFIDVESSDIFGKIYNVDSSVPLWPMFGVFNPDLATVSMSLVVGSDIDMTERKKALILECLT